jgi:transposase
MLPKEIQDLLSLIPEEYQILIRPILLFYEEKVEKLEARLKELEDQISKNSRNSSKPPSTDEHNKPSPKSRRKKSGRKAGGQKGHDGNNLKMVESPDVEERYKVEVCACCRKSLRRQEADAIERRQVYDVPALELLITEHQVEIKRCSCGHVNRADFPSGVDHYVQYGPNIKSLLVYMQDYQLLPYERTKEFVEDIFGHQLSTGTLYNIRQYAFDQLATFEDRLKALLTVAVVAGFDETGIRIMAQRLWLHSCSTAHHAYYAAHAKRGQQAMDDIDSCPGNFEHGSFLPFWPLF